MSLNLAFKFLERFLNSQVNAVYKTVQKNVPPKEQKAVFKIFYEASSKAPQGTIFGGFILSGRFGHRRAAEPKKTRLITWTYVFKVDGNVVEVCRSFILCVFQISEKNV